MAGEKQWGWGWKGNGTLFRDMALVRIWAMKGNLGFNSSLWLSVEKSLGDSTEGQKQEDQLRGYCCSPNER